MQIQILQERPQDQRHIEPLLDLTFGPERHQRTTYRLREGVPPLAELCHVALDPYGTLLASLRFWPVLAASAPAILLGPLAVAPRLQGRGIGRGLLRHALAEARRLDHGLCIVVGDPAYYAPFGFRSAVAAGLVMPGPVEPARFQVLELAPGALEERQGVVAACPRAPGAAQVTGEGAA